MGKNFLMIAYCLFLLPLLSIGQITQSVLAQSYDANNEDELAFAMAKLNAITAMDTSLDNGDPLSRELFIACPTTRKDTIKCKGTGPADGFSHILTTTLSGGTWAQVPSSGLYIDQDPSIGYRSTVYALQGGSNYTFVYNDGTCTDTVKVAVIIVPQTCVPSFNLDNMTVTMSSLAISSSVGITVNSTTTDAASILGGERDVKIELATTPTPANYDCAVQVVNNSFEWINGSGDHSKVTITWDGNDNDANTLNATGLGGVDLSGAGNFGFLFSLDVNKVKYTLRVYTNASNYSQSVFTSNQADTQWANIPVEYLNFTTMAGTGANFKNVGAVQLILEPLFNDSSDDGIDAALACFHSPCLVPCPTKTCIPLTATKN